MFYGAIRGMVSALGDPYTVFLPPEEQKNSKEDLGGSFEGVGIELGFNEDKRLVVIAPLEGTPAKNAGVLPNDMIVKINDKDATGINITDAVKLIRGPKGSEVVLTVYREGDGDTREFKLTRDTIVVKSVILSYAQTPSSKKVAVVKLTRFGERTQEEWDEAVSNILASGSQGMVLDLRNDPGGFMDRAISIASEFIASGDVMMHEDSQGQRTSYPVNRSGKLLKMPLVVLINKGSASASEIVSGALQDHGRAKLVGDKSFGKGTIQETEDLKNGTGIHITVAKWLTPKGRWVNELKGLDPDVKVELPKLSLSSSEGSASGQLQSPSPKPSVNGVNANDTQLQKALEVLQEGM